MAKKPAVPRKKAPAKPKAAAAAPGQPDPSRKTALDIANWSLDKKALDVVVLDVRGLASYAEYVVVMTAESDPQMGAIADYLEEKMKLHGQRALGIEGQRSGRWVLIDFGDVVAHVFDQDTRGFYDIEGLWSEAPRQTVTDEPAPARGSAKA